MSSDRSNEFIIWNGTDDEGWPAGVTVRCGRCDGVMAADGVLGEHAAVRCDVPTREYAASSVRARVVPGGVFADFQSDDTRRVAHEIRSARPDITNKKLARLLGCQRPAHAHRAYVAWRLRSEDAPARTGGRGVASRQFVDESISPEADDTVF